MITAYHSSLSDKQFTITSGKFRRGSWVHVVDPTFSELEQLSTALHLDIDLLTDAMDLYEAPRIEKEEGSIYIFTRYYNANNGVINATEPLLIVYAKSNIVTILRTKSGLLEPYISGGQEVITTHKTLTLLQILEAVNATYRLYLTKTTKKMFAVRSQLKKASIHSKVLLELVETEDDLNEIISALQPQELMFGNLLDGKFIKLFEDDEDLVEDLKLGTAELMQLAKSRLKTIINIRQTYDALATNDLNKTFRRLTSISIFLMIPTILSGLYGMNVVLPFANHQYAFWYVVGVLFGLSATVVYVFRRNRWL
jgi:magnesium transporter